MPTPHDRWVEAFSDTPMTTPALQITTVSGDVPVSGAPVTIEVLAGQLDGAGNAPMLLVYLKVSVTRLGLFLNPLGLFCRRSC